MKLFCWEGSKEAYKRSSLKSVKFFVKFSKRIVRTLFLGPHMISLVMPTGICWQNKKNGLLVNSAGVLKGISACRFLAQTFVATATKRNRATIKMCSMRFSTRIMYNDACRRLCFDSANNFCPVYLVLLTCALLFPACGRHTHKDALNGLTDVHQMSFSNMSEHAALLVLSFWHCLLSGRATTCITEPCLKRNAARLYHGTLKDEITTTDSNFFDALTFQKENEKHWNFGCSQLSCCAVGISRLTELICMSKQWCYRRKDNGLINRNSHVWYFQDRLRRAACVTVG